MTARDAAWDDLRRRATARPVGPFASGLTGSLPPPAQRYLGAVIAEGTPLAAAAQLEMRGRIKIGRWLPFRARQLLAPSLGTVWMATVAGVIRGSDRYVGGDGAMAWKLFGLVPVMRADGADVSRSAAERAAAESIWVPTAVAGDPTASWSAAGESAVDVAFSVEDHRVGLRHTIDADGRLQHSQIARWGDPDNTGAWAQHPFGVEAPDHRTFGGVTIPCAGSVSWRPAIHSPRPVWPTPVP